VFVFDHACLYVYRLACGWWPRTHGQDHPRGIGPTSVPARAAHGHTHATRPRANTQQHRHVHACTHTDSDDDVCSLTHRQQRGAADTHTHTARCWGGRCGCECGGSHQECGCVARPTRIPTATDDDCAHTHRHKHTNKHTHRHRHTHPCSLIRAGRLCV
jgi:hypothetical protein